MLNLNDKWPAIILTRLTNKWQQENKLPYFDGIYIYKTIKYLPEAALGPFYLFGERYDVEVKMPLPNTDEYFIDYKLLNTDEIIQEVLLTLNETERNEFFADVLGMPTANE